MDYKWKPPIKMDDLGVFTLFLETSISTLEGILVDKFSLIHRKGRFFHTQMVFLEIPPTSSSQLLLAPALLQDSSAPRKAVWLG